jgi:hypothetical protein
LNGSKKNKPREFNEKLTNYMEYYDFGGILDFVRN